MEGHHEAICKDCGKVFYVPMARYAKVPKFVPEVHLPLRCPECKQICKHRKDQRKRHGAECPVWTCQQCGKEYTGHKRKFCSERCAADSLREGPKAHVCEACGETFILPATSGPVKYCSDECRKGPNQTATCSHCGNEYKTRRTKAGNGFCSSSCVRKYRKAIIKRKQLEGVKRIDCVPRRHLIGELAERLFDAWCVANSIPCFAPVLRHQPCADRVVLLDCKWLSVQVKGTVSHKRTGSHDDLSEVDVLACVNVETAEIVLVSREYVESHTKAIWFPSAFRGDDDNGAMVRAGGP